MNEEVVKQGSAAVSGFVMLTGAPASSPELGDRLKAAAAAIRGNSDDQQLDPGIADVVIMLRNLGFHPTDSGDGRSKPDVERNFDVKHVACTVDEAQLFDEARRLHDVLGWGWKVEASFDPSAGGSCLLLATKNEPPAPRHQDAIDLWKRTISPPARDANDNGVYGPYVDAGNILLAALKHELGRR